MMEQRTLNIINICKGNTKYYGLYDDIDMIEAIKQYMADECAYKAEWYTDREISNIIYEAVKDYIDHCDKPSFFLSCLQEVMDRRNCDIFYAMLIVFCAYTQVKDGYGNYVNGFDDRIHALDKEEF